jgi:hypothetical protein
VARIELPADLPVTLPPREPCVGCPYRTDSPSGVWAVSEYAVLPEFDNETPYQPTALFMCHKGTGRICAGWAGCHDMEDNLALRLARARGEITPRFYLAMMAYTTTVELFASGAQACQHGVAGMDDPDPEARALIARLARKLPRIAAQLTPTDDPRTENR